MGRPAGRPFPFHGGTLLSDQAQFDPMDVLDALVAELRVHGGLLHEGRRVVSVSKHGRPRATLDDGSTVEAEDVILATGTPFLDRGLYFAKVEPLVLRSCIRHPGCPRRDVPVRRIAGALDPRRTRHRRGRSCWSAATATLWVGRFRARAPRRPPGMDHAALPRRGRDPCLVGAGLPITRRHPVRRPSASGRRAHPSRHRVRQVGDDERRRRGPQRHRGHPRREAVLGTAAGPTGHPSARSLQHRAHERRGRPGRERARSSTSIWPASRPSRRGRGRRRPIGPRADRGVDGRRTYLRGRRICTHWEGCCRGTTRKRRGTARCTDRGSPRTAASSRVRPRSRCMS